jgi:GTP-binding protein EngB required for normal cell division
VRSRQRTPASPAGAGVGPARAALATIAELGPGRLPDERVTEVVALVDQVDERLGRGEGLTVAALAGGTGVGKSALVNALLARPLAVEGVRRPTTSVPMAAAAEQDGPVTALLDWLEVPERHAVGEALPAGAVLLDLPDHDSVVTSHRRTAARLATRVDVVVWVLDPVKYARADAHHGPLGDLTAHADVLLVVLNRVDELPAGEVEVVLADLRARLEAAGHQRARVVATSAVTGQGVAELRDVLAQLAEARTAAATRLLGDAVVLARRIDHDLEPLPEADVEATAWVPELVEAVDGGRVTADAARAARRGAELGARSPLARAVRAPLRRVLRSFVGGPLPAASRLPSRAEVTARVGTVAARRLTALEATGRTHTALDGAVAAAADAAAPLLRDAVAAARPDPPSPRWPAALAALRLVAELTALAGAGWLTALAVVRWLQLPPLPTPDAIGALPWPTALLLGGLVVRVLLGLLTRVLARARSRRHGRAVAKRLRRGIREVAEGELLAPVRDELDAQRRLRGAVRTLSRSA